MKDREFIEKLEQLDASCWQDILTGQAIHIVDDQSLEVASEGSGNVVVSASSFELADADELRREVISRAPEFLCRYYQAHPLSLVGFNQQVTRLVREHGAEAFAAPSGEFPERTLFVDGSEVMAESAESPRQRYGAYCELDTLSDGQDVEAYVIQWIEQGEAYERYLEMNVCRYNC